MTTRNEQRVIQTKRLMIRAEYVDELEVSPDWFTAVGDLLADLRHVAANQGFDFDNAVEHSIMHYEMEVREDNYQVHEPD